MRLSSSCFNQQTYGPRPQPVHFRINLENGFSHCDKLRPAILAIWATSCSSAPPKGSALHLSSLTALAVYAMQSHVCAQAIQSSKLNLREHWRSHAWQGWHWLLKPEVASIFMEKNQYHAYTDFSDGRESLSTDMFSEVKAKTQFGNVCTNTQSSYW